MTSLRSLVATTALVIAAVGGVALESKAQDRSFWLYNGQSANTTGYFFAGESIYGECDVDCYDLDLFLYDSNGSLVSSDTALDAYPIVTAPYEGYFSIAVTMPNCSHSAGCAASVSSDYGF